MLITESVVDRLARNHTKVGDCWLWNKSLRGGGYGYLKISGRKYVSSRVSYTHYKGEIPDGYFVCHKCDNPSCINPDHLFIGTQKDNMQDKIAKGRVGNTRCHDTKLKPMDVLTIRSCLESGISKKDIARYYRLDRRYIFGIERGDYWKDITGGVPTSNYKPILKLKRK